MSIVDALACGLPAFAKRFAIFAVGRAQRVACPCGRRFLFALLLGSLFAGCGPKLPATVPVRGTITYGGGAWPKPGILYFTIVKPAEGFPGRTGTAPFDTQGRFVVKTWQNVEGLMPGTYHVGIDCWEVPPTMGGPPAVSCVPRKYRNAATSGIELVIAPGDAAKELSLDVPKEQPGKH